MIEINNITMFFGWCTVITTSILIFTSIILSLMKNSISKIHSNVFGLNQADIPLVYFQYLGNLKIAIIIFNLAPYIALKIMS